MVVEEVKTLRWNPRETKASEKTENSNQLFTQQKLIQQSEKISGEIYEIYVNGRNQKNESSGDKLLLEKRNVSSLWMLNKRFSTVE